MTKDRGKSIAAKDVTWKIFAPSRNGATLKLPFLMWVDRSESLRQASFSSPVRIKVTRLLRTVLGRRETVYMKRLRKW